MSATVILTSKSLSPLSEAMCFLIDYRIDPFSHRWAMSRSTFTHTSRMFGTGSPPARIISFNAESRKPSPCTDRQICFSEYTAAILKWKHGSLEMVSLSLGNNVFTQPAP